MSRFVKIDIQSHLFNPLLEEKVLPNPHGVTNKDKKALEATGIVSFVLRFWSRFITFQSEFNLLFKLIDFEKSMDMATVNRRC